MMPTWAMTISLNVCAAFIIVAFHIVYAVRHTHMIALQSNFSEISKIFGNHRDTNFFVDLETLASPDVGILGEFLTQEDVVSIDNTLNFSVEFFHDNQRYRLTKANRPSFNYECKRRYAIS